MSTVRVVAAGTGINPAESHSGRAMTPSRCDANTDVNATVTSPSSSAITAGRRTASMRRAATDEKARAPKRSALAVTRAFGMDLDATPGAADRAGNVVDAEEGGGR